MVEFYVGWMGRMGGCLSHVRIGSSLIDLQAYDSPLSHKLHAGGSGLPEGAPAPPMDPEAGTLDHFAISVGSYNPAALREYLTSKGFPPFAEGQRYGADGDGYSTYVRDPEGNIVELKHFPDDSWSAGYQGSPRTCPDETVSTSSSSRRHPCRCSTPTPGPHAGCICQAAEAHARLGGLGARAPARGHPRQPLPEIFALYSSPMGQDALNVHKEVRVIHDALDQSGSGVRLRVGAATLESLTSLLTLARSGTRRGLALHLSAHAHKDETRGVGLMLEDEFGVGHLYYRDQLEDPGEQGLAAEAFAVPA
ncbi:unnamed protein product [Prorocentrum cordatum]|uniref:VOC domain-containing protein n=1 Tax=Prorocentrum cordatum TaxID=2364126 RepID=A0ABN9SEN2_9DINO|nr:unnamed protein product [Polarella glacialis]